MMCLIAACDRPARERTADGWAVTRDAVAGEGDGPGALTVVGDVTVGADGVLYATQPQESLIRSYDRQGRFLRAIGREGEGPGEFDQLGELGWRADTLWVQDPGNRRLSFFGPDLRYVRSVSFTSEGPMTRDQPNIPGYALADGSVLGYWQAPLEQLVGRTVTDRLVRFTEAGEPASVLDSVELRNLFSVVPTPSGVTYSPQPFTDSPLMRVAQDGSFVVIVTREAANSADSAAFGVRRIDLSGRVLMNRQYPYTPVPLASRAVDSTVNAMSGTLSSNGMGRSSEASLRRNLRKALYIPSHLTPVSSVVLGRDGTILLRRERTGEPTIGWTVLDSAGTRLADLRLPTRTLVHYADRSQIWAVEQDSLDVPTLVRYRVTPR